MNKEPIDNYFYKDEFGNYIISEFEKLNLLTKSLNMIGKYIEQLQQENKELKETNKVLSKKLTKDTVLKQDHIYTFCGVPLGEAQEKVFGYEELQSRIDKAIEYINTNKDMVDWIEVSIYDLLSILKGDVNE